LDKFQPDKNMALNKKIGLLDYLWSLERAICIYFNQFNQAYIPSTLFGRISRLGNGRFWYLLIGLLPLLHGVIGFYLGLKMMTLGLVALVAYFSLKKLTQRLRPYEAYPNILITEPALDQFSFPSGHTLHAACFSTILISFEPIWSWLLIPFTALIALSRLVLGLHYPSDVFIGALIGVSIASVGNHLWVL
jgi:undecaprenyl-diphosphatase